MASTGAHEASALEGEGNGLDSLREHNQATRDPPGCGVNRPARNAAPIRPQGHELSRGENRPNPWGEPARLAVIPWGEPAKLLVKNNYSSNSMAG